MEKKEREKRAANIRQNPSHFKICHGCFSIVAARVVICPNCHSYRYEEDPRAVIEHAETLVSQEQGLVTPDDLLT